MAARMRQLHNRSAQCNDAMVKKSLIFDYREFKICTPPERLQGRIFEMCGPIVHFVMQAKKSHAGNPTVLPY